MQGSGDGTVIENRALIHLSNIMIANARAHKYKEMAILSQSPRAVVRLYGAVDTLLSLVTTKTINTEKDKVEAIIKAMDGINGKSVEAATAVLRTAIDNIEAIIRAHKWYDMPRFDGSDMSLISEFYEDVKPKDTEEVQD